MTLKYEKLTKENLPIIKDLQRAIFPESSFEAGYNLVIEKGPEPFGNIMQEYYIVYADNEVAGTMGLYIPQGVEEHHSIWLGWYGILPTFRGKGIGKQILLDSIEMSKSFSEKYPIKYFRLYTSEIVNDSAQPLYNKVMDLKEYYKHSEIFSEKIFMQLKNKFPDKTEDEYREIISKSIAVFSKSLFKNEILVPWDSYYMSLMKTVALEKNNIPNN